MKSKNILVTGCAENLENTLHLLPDHLNAMGERK